MKEREKTREEREREREIVVLKLKLRSCCSARKPIFLIQKERGIEKNSKKKRKLERGR